jgi:hypothetical protein
MNRVFMKKEAYIQIQRLHLFWNNNLALFLAKVFISIECFRSLNEDFRA